jgi:hypothetical protein
MPIGELSENSISVPLPEEPPNSAAARALGDFRQDAAPEADIFDDYTWTVANETGDEIALLGRGIVGGGDDRIGYGYAYADRIGDEWRIQRFGTCRLRVTAEGYGSAIWALAARPDPSQSTIALVVNELDCANGEGPIDRDVVPVILSDAQQVAIVILVEPVSGNANCLSNPWHPVVVDVGSPVGSRQLLDAGTVPARLQEWPPSQQYLDTFGQSG